MSKRKVDQERLITRMGRKEKFLPKRKQIIVFSEHFTEDCFKVEQKSNNTIQVAVNNFDCFHKKEYCY